VHHPGGLLAGEGQDIGAACKAGGIAEHWSDSLTNGKRIGS
jgi:hypothetical protein